VKVAGMCEGLTSSITQLSRPRLSMDVPPLVDPVLSCTEREDEFIWNLYFPERTMIVSGSDADSWCRSVQLAWRPILQGDEQALQRCEKVGILDLDLNDICNACPDSCDLRQKILGKPAETLPLLGWIAHTMFFRRMSTCIHIRLYGIERTQLKKLKSNVIDKLVCVRGAVVRVSSVRPLLKSAAFSCSKCGWVVRVHFTEGKFASPSNCGGDGCRAKKFTMLASTVTTVDVQTVRLQECGEEMKDPGRIPRSLECEMTEDLVDTCLPGDIVTVVGIVRVAVAPSEQGGMKSSSAGTASLYLLYLSAVSVSSSTLMNDVASSSLSSSFSSEERDWRAMIHLAALPQLFRLLVHSLCPTIAGNSLIKMGLLLALLGGSESRRHLQPSSSSSAGDAVTVRRDIHVLVVGDPGLGKSQLLRAAAAVSPRGVYVCGNTTSTAGLTVSVTREAGTGDFTLEAGALVLSDRGICVIDEFDKMGCEHAALLEVMEQQSISIAKAGIVCSLPARTAVVAAANPVGGTWQKHKSVAENLRFPPALLSRFDIVFLVLDKPNEAMDALLSAHVMKLHRAEKGVNARNGNLGLGRSSPTIDIAAMTTGNTSEEALSLESRLNVSAKDAAEIDSIPHALLRKYVTYARKYCHPILSPSAQHSLKAFFLELRENRDKHHGGMPITTRQLESIIRLAEARAKAELSEEVTGQHANDVIELVRYSMKSLYADDDGIAMFSNRGRKNAGGGSSGSVARTFLAGIQRSASQLSKILFSVTELQEVARQCGVPQTSFYEVLDTLNQQSFLLKKGPRFYELQ